MYWLLYNVWNHCFIYFIQFFICYGRRINLVPVAPSWLETKLTSECWKFCGGISFLEKTQAFQFTAELPTTKYGLRMNSFTNIYVTHLVPKDGWVSSWFILSLFQSVSLVRVVHLTTRVITATAQRKRTTVISGNPNPKRKRHSSQGK